MDLKWTLPWSGIFLGEGRMRTWYAPDNRTMRCIAWSEDGGKSTSCWHQGEWLDGFQFEFCQSCQDGNGFHNDNSPAEMKDDLGNRAPRNYMRLWHVLLWPYCLSHLTGGNNYCSIDLKRPRSLQGSPEGKRDTSPTRGPASRASLQALVTWSHPGTLWRHSIEQTTFCHPKGSRDTVRRGVLSNTVTFATVQFAS